MESAEAIPYKAVPLPCARLLSRGEASAYIGVSASTFDKMIRDGQMPQPKRIYSRKLWDVRKLDSAIEDLPCDDIRSDNAWD